jgi:hypothetical protein
METDEEKYDSEPAVNGLRQLLGIRRRRGDRASTQLCRRGSSSSYPRVLGSPIGGLDLPDLRRQAYRRGR